MYSFGWMQIAKATGYCSKKLAFKGLLIHHRYSSLHHQSLAPRSIWNEWQSKLVFHNIWCQVSFLDVNRELKQWWECQWEHYKTVDLITKYNHFTWECNYLTPVAWKLVSINQWLNFFICNWVYLLKDWFCLSFQVYLILGFLGVYYSNTLEWRVSW